MVQHHECLAEKKMRSHFDQLKQNNIRKTMLQLFSDGRATKQQLVMETGLSNTTVSDLINGFVRQGIVLPDGMDTSSGGRCSRIYVINRNYGSFIGAALFGSCIAVARCDMDLRVVTFESFPFSPPETPITALFRSLETALADGPVLHIGIGFQGSLDTRWQIVLKSAELGWENVPLRELVERRFRTSTYIDIAVNGQIPLFQYLPEYRMKQNLIVTSDLVPSKMGICIDGNICRGDSGLCGTPDGAEAAGDQAVRLAGILSVSSVVIGNASGTGGVVVRPGDTAAGIPSVFQVKISQEDIARGMAMMAETEWFASLDF